MDGLELVNYLNPSAGGAWENCRFFLALPQSAISTNFLSEKEEVHSNDVQQDLISTPPAPLKGMKAQEKAGVGEEPGREGGWQAAAQGPGGRLGPGWGAPSPDR